VRGSYLDSDQDGIPDHWEDRGVQLHGGPFINLPLMGASKMHKDIFVQVDSMQSSGGVSFQPPAGALDRAERAFMNMQVNNPDGTQGINLHIDSGPNSTMNIITHSKWRSLSASSSNITHIQDIVPYNPEVPDSLSWSSLDAAKSQGGFMTGGRAHAFHYCLFADQFDTMDPNEKHPGLRGGVSRGIPASDFVVAMGAWAHIPNPFLPPPDQVASTLAHELGHNLGLHHGGSDDVNYKPNFLSIMNYSFSYNGVLSGSPNVIPKGQLTYSSRALNPLDETNLDEHLGINDPDGHITAWQNGPPPPNQDMVLLFSNLSVNNPFFDTPPLIDWNQDGLLEAGEQVDLTGEADVNGNPIYRGAANPAHSYPVQGFSDYPALQFNGGGGIGTGSMGPNLAPGAADSENTGHDDISDIPEFVLCGIPESVSVSPEAGGDVPLTVTFDASATIAPCGTIVSYAWNFGDSTNGTGATTSHVYTTPGTYIASVTITDSNGNLNRFQQQYTINVTSGPPAISLVSPSSGPVAGGTQITITGSNFTNYTTVTVGGSFATSVSVVNGTTITATTPGSGSAVPADVVVTSVDGETVTLTGGFTYLNPAPTVTRIAPATGPTAGGTSVTITGTGFASGATVTVGGVPATNVSVGSATSITATTPAHAGGAVNVVVTNTDTQTGTLTGGFTYVNPAPTVASISPGSGAISGGTAVTITGTGFLSGATVSVGGSAATGVVVVSATSITATTPAHAAGAVSVVVTNTDNQSGTLTNAFTYSPAPTVTAIAPTAGPASGGTSVTITGTGFLSGAMVTIGGAAATGITIVSNTSITSTSPPNAAGAVNIVVTNTDGQSGTLTNGFTYNGPPTVTAISPVSGSAAGGTAITITGTGFVSGATVSLGGTAATGVTVVSATSITATTPAHAAGSVNVVVTNSDSQSGTLTNGFTYNPPPTVTAIAPVSGPATGGTSVTITGTGFLSGASVLIGGTAATGVSVTSSTSITAVTPAHSAGTVNVVVTNTDGQSGTLTNGFTYNPAPTVTSISPTFGPIGGGTAVTITGAGFVSGASVTIGGTAATGTSVVSATSITATSAGHAAATVNVVVTNADGQSGTLSNGFTYNGPPTVTAISPTAGAIGGGTAVTITGTGFRSGATVALGGTAATGVTILSGTSITATTGAHAAGTVSVVVTNSDGQSGTLTNGFAYNPAPAVSAISPPSGPAAGGSPVVITGTGFLSGASVAFGGTSASGVTVVSSTSITATTPAHAAGLVNVVVTNIDTQIGTLTNGFTYNPPPAVTVISPNSGPTAGGTSVTITGAGFVSGASVSFGGAAATGVTVVSSTSITAMSPAHAAGAVNVVVTNTDGQSGTLTSGFTYNGPPTVTAISPTSGSTGGGTAVTITGTGFLSGATVALGGTSATGVTVVSATSITATTAAHAAGAVNVVVTNADNQSGTLSSGFTYNTAPTVTGISPTSGPTGGGTAVTITGTGFLSGATVTLGGTAATAISVVSSTSITATTAAHAGGVVDVVVTNIDSQFGTLASGFTYNPPPTVTAISPASGPIGGGTAVTVTGTGFRSGATVTIGGVSATGVSVVSSTSITATSAAHAAGTVNVIVTNTDSQSGTLTNGFIYNPPPTVTAVSPALGSTGGGTAVTITGAGFVTGASVSFGGATASGITVASSTSITATTPAHAAGAVNVAVTNTDGQTGSLANGFTYSAAPTVTAISPPSGPMGGSTPVTITGTGFLAGASVTLGGTAATDAVVVNSTTITATTETHASGAVDVVVTNPGGQSGTLVGGYVYTFLQDDFSKIGLDTNLWARTLFSSTQNTSISVGDTNDQLLIGPLLVKKTGTNYNGISSLSTFNFTGAYCYIQLVQGPLASTMVQAQLTAGSSLKDWYQIEVQGSSLKCVKSIDEVATTLFTTTYNSTNHQFLRIRHDAVLGYVVFETAPNNGGLPGAWTQQYSEPWNSEVVLTTITFEIKAGTIQSETSPGSIIFDNFNAG
jgi:hypothetical protein